MSNPADRPDYKNTHWQRMSPSWEKVNDLYEGTARIRQRADIYLPAFPQEKPRSHKRRVSQTVFFNYFRKTIRNVAGLVFRKPPVFADGADEMTALLENVDAHGKHWHKLASELMVYTLLEGHTYLFTENPRQLPPGSTLNDARKANFRPYWVHYRAPQAINWLFDDTTGQLAQLTMMECVEVPDGLFGIKSQNVYRVLRPGSWELHTPGPNDSFLVESGASSLKDVPLAVIYSNQTGPLTSRPPYEDLGDVNILHCQLGSDEDQLIHKTCVPIYYAVGRVNRDKPMVVSGDTFVDLEPSGSLGVVEVAGTALAVMANKRAALEKNMAMLGLSSLVAKDVQLTATQMVLETLSDANDLQLVASGLQDALNQNLQWLAEYAGISQPGKITVDVDAIPRIEAQKVAVLSAMVEKGQLDLETLLTVLSDAGEFGDDFKLETTLDNLTKQAERNRANADQLDNML